MVTKQNVLNEIRSNNMTLQELRFFSIYLSKINPKNLKTRVVRFPLSDFQKIMELKELKISYVKNITDSMLSKIVRVPLSENGSYTSFQLFKKCTVRDDETGEWYVEIDAHDDALPLMFEFKDRYFAYKLWNALRLKSVNQLRMYEILKQYEKVGERIISVNELKELLGLKLTEYTRFGDFKEKVLMVCQEALEKYTDIKYSFEPTGRKGPGGKVINLKFYIQKNKNHVDPLLLENFLGKDSMPDNQKKFINRNESMRFLPWLKSRVSTHIFYEMIEAIKVNINGKDYTMNSILKDNKNYICLSDFKQAGFDIGYNSEKKIPSFGVGVVYDLFNICGTDKKVSKILKQNENYVWLRDLEDIIDIDYDANNKKVVLNRK